MADKGGVGKSLVSLLKAKNINVIELDSSLSAEDLEKHLSQLNSRKVVKGVYWLAALDNEADFSKMDYKAWREENRIRIKLLYTTMRTLYDSNPFLVSATRLGGHFGYDDKGSVAPLGGAVCGFTKTYKREKSNILSKVIDFEASKKTKALAEIILNETLFDPGAVEIGYKHDHRWTIGLEEKSLKQDSKGMKLSKDSVFVITGAAGSIVSAIISDLAENSAGIFYLLDLTEKPDPNNADIQRFASDKENLKLYIFNRLKESGERATPTMVEKELAKIERMQSALVAIQEIEKAGGQANYFSVNLLDNKAVGNIVKDIRKKHKKIDVLIHAGGLEISRSLPDKNPV